MAAWAAFPVGLTPLTIVSDKSHPPHNLLPRIRLAQSSLENSYSTLRSFCCIQSATPRLLVTCVCTSSSRLGFPICLVVGGAKHVAHARKSTATRLHTINSRLFSPPLLVLPTSYFTTKHSSISHWFPLLRVSCQFIDQVRFILHGRCIVIQLFLFWCFTYCPVFSPLSDSKLVQFR